MNNFKIIKNLILSRLKNKPYKLNFALTSICNSKCKTCNVWKNKDTRFELSLEEISTMLKKAPDTITWLSLSGGEPFLKKDLMKIVKAAKTHLPNLEMVSVPTNGLIPIENSLKEMIDMGIPSVFVTFSIDGPEKIHDKIRGVNGGFKKTWNNYLKAKELSKKIKNLKVIIEITISKFNIDYAQEFIEQMQREEHDVTITIAHDGYLYMNNDHKNSYVLDSSFEEKIKQIIKIKKKQLSVKDFVENIYLQKIPDYLKNNKKFIKSCVALKRSIALDAKGNITPCFMWEKKIENIRDFDYDINKIWNLKSRKLIRKDIKNGLCPGCWTPCEAYQSIISKFL